MKRPTGTPVTASGPLYNVSVLLNACAFPLQVNKLTVGDRTESSGVTALYVIDAAAALRWFWHGALPSERVGPGGSRFGPRTLLSASALDRVESGLTLG